jgi:hypothetical protein
MTLMKAVVRGILLASLASPPARAGSILYLGVSSGDAAPSQPAVASSLPSASVPSIPIGSAPSLQLGVFSDPVPSQPSPSMAPATVPPGLPTPVVAAPAVSSTQPPSPSGKFDAFINLGSAPYPDAAALTSGSPQPWYVGAGVDRLFGGIPSIQQAATFDQTVLQRVQQTFGLSGIPVSLTADPNAPAAHTVSVVSQTSNPTIGNALGMTYLGGNGFQYIDTAAQSATSVDQLEWIVAHNIAHELMLAFGVPEVNDKSGQYIDAQNANWSMITSPTATFSPGAIADLLSSDFQAGGGAVLNPSAQLLGPPTVPEPSAVALWLAIGSVGLVAVRSARRPALSRQG